MSWESVCERGQYTEHQIAQIRAGIPQHLFSVPVKELQASTISLIAKFLDLPLLTLSKCNHLGDFTGLAELLKFDRQSIALLENMLQGQQSPTVRLLQNWTGPNAVVGQLIYYLKLLERSDLLVQLEFFIDRDVCQWMEQREQQLAQVVQSDNQIITLDYEPEEKATILELNDKQLFTKDVLKGPHFYEAFVSYCAKSIKDRELMKIICDRLEKEKIKVARGSYSLIRPIATVESYAAAIVKRCNRVVFLISKDFNSSEECLFQLTHAFSKDCASLQRKVIPVLLEKVNTPRLISHLSTCEYYRKDLDEEEYFWPQLIAGIKAD